MLFFLEYKFVRYFDCENTDLTRDLACLLLARYAPDAGGRMLEGSLLGASEVSN